MVTASAEMCYCGAGLEYNHEMIAGDIAYLIEQDGECSAEFVGGSYVVSMVEITAPSGAKYLVSVQKLEEI